MNSKRAFLVRAAKAASWGWDREVLRAIEHLRDIGIVLDRRYPSKCDVYDAILDADPDATLALNLPSIKDIYNHRYPPLRGNVTFFLQCYAESVDKDGTITV